MTRVVSFEDGSSIEGTFTGRPIYLSCIVYSKSLGNVDWVVGIGVLLYYVVGFVQAQNSVVCGAVQVGGD